MRHSQAYYIRHGYGVYAIRNKREAKALYDFCAEQIVEMFGKPIDNPDETSRMEIFKRTMDIYANNFLLKPEAMPTELIECHCGHCHKHFVPYDIWTYANEHANWYWS